MPIELSEEQQKVKNNIIEWYSSGEDWYTTLTGNAGTGKTTLLGALVKEMATPARIVRLVTFTGKAASVLQAKLTAFGVDSPSVVVSTLHSFLYAFLGKDNTGKPRFALNGEVTADLVIVDEASMITEKMAADLKKCNMRVLFVGDPGQLPPVEGKSFLSAQQQQENHLTTIHRQAEGNPILKMAYMARDGQRIPFGAPQQGVGKFRNSPDTQKIIKKFMGTMDGADNGVLLCAKNKTRAALNRSARTVLGTAVSEFPMPQERVVCLRNNKFSGIMNGQFGVVTSVISHLHEGTGILLLELGITVEGREIRSLCPAETFGSATALSLASSQEEAILHGFDSYEQVDSWDFGYAVSVHKSQGSEWDRVVLFDERMFSMDDSSYSKWLYTGITRAKQKLCIVA